MSAITLTKPTPASENSALKETVQAYINEIQKLKMDIEILNQDRKLLYQETIQLKEENVKLQANITRLEMATEKYKALVQQSNDKLQQTNQNQMAAVQTIRSISSSAEQDKEFRAKFNLPDGEFSIISYHCSNESLQSGLLHITPYYVCFELNINIGLFNAIAKTTETVITMPIKEIVILNKVKLMKFLPGKGTCVEFKMADGKVRLFKGFIRRKECLRNISNQAQTIGHTIQMLRENQPDINQNER